MLESQTCLTITSKVIIKNSVHLKNVLLTQIDTNYNLNVKFFIIQVSIILGWFAL